MGKKRVMCTYGVEIGVTAGWQGPYASEDFRIGTSCGGAPGEDPSVEISPGMFAGTIGVRRLLKLFEKYDMKATWFIPGHSLETFPEECAMVRDAGHEIGLPAHGYSHKNPADITEEEWGPPLDFLDRSYRLLTKFCGKPPRGNADPWWGRAPDRTEVILKYGIEYNHSVSRHDCQPCYLRVGDTRTKINYKEEAERLTEPLVRWTEFGLVEIPRSLYINDFSMTFIENENFHCWANPRDVEDIWRAHFNYFYREHDEFIFPITIHPGVSGHPHVLLLHERLIEHINKHEGVEWVTMEYICDDFKMKNPYPAGATLPSPPGEVLTKTRVEIMEEILLSHFPVGGCILF